MLSMLPIHAEFDHLGQYGRLGLVAAPRPRCFTAAGTETRSFWVQGMDLVTEPQGD